MQKKLKEAPISWRLCKGDLPDERTIASEPRLAGMDENPVFRAILFRRHQLSRGGSRWIAQYVLMGLLTIILLMSGMGASLIVYTLVFGLMLGLSTMWALLSVGFSSLFGTFSILHGMMREFGFGPKREAGMIKTIPDQLAVDMVHAAVSSEEFALGMWASVCSRPQVRRRKIILAAAAVPLWAWMLIPALAGGDPALTGIATGGLVGVFWMAALTLRVPYFELWLQALLVKDSYIRIRGWLDPRLLIWLHAQVALGISASLVTIMLMAGLLFYVSETMYLRYIFDEFFTGGKEPILAVVASAIGFWLGDIHGRYIRWRSERFLKRMTDHLDFILPYAHQYHIHPGSR